MADLSERIEQAAQLPASTKTDGLESSEHGLKDLVEAARYLDRKRLAKQPAGGIRFIKLIPPGTGGT